MQGQSEQTSENLGVYGLGENVKKSRCVWFCEKCKKSMKHKKSPKNAKLPHAAALKHPFSVCTLVVGAIYVHPEVKVVEIFGVLGGRA